MKPPRMKPLLLLLCPAVADAHQAGTAAASSAAPTVGAGIALALAAAIYLRAMQLRAPLSRRQAGCFALGWLCLAVSIAAPLERLVAASFALHMGQHLLLMVAAPPLLILGHPYAALGAVLPRRALRLAAWPLRISPLAAWLLHAAALWLWHVPRLFDAALDAAWIHAAQHASFFFSALLFWWTVFRRVHSGLAVLMVLTTLIHSGALAALLSFAPHAFYRDTSLAQQQLGGLIMWVPAGYAFLLAGLIAFDRLLGKQA